MSNRKIETRKNNQNNKLHSRFKVCNCVKEGRVSPKERQPSGPIKLSQKEKTYKQKCIQFFVTYSKF